MKKAIVIAILAITATGCFKCMKSDDIDGAWTYHGNSTYTKVVEIGGHKYVIMRGYKTGGIVHAASCNCQQK